MLNDVRPPPAEPFGPVEVPEMNTAHAARNPAVKPHEHLRPQTDDRLPGRHKPRVIGEPATTDAVYAMPMEDRGSAFSLALSAVVVVTVFVTLMIVWASLFR